MGTGFLCFTAEGEDERLVECLRSWDGDVATCQRVQRGVSREGLVTPPTACDVTD